MDQQVLMDQADMEVDLADQALAVLAQLVQDRILELQDRALIPDLVQLGLADLELQVAEHPELQVVEQLVVEHLAPPQVAEPRALEALDQDLEQQVHLAQLMDPEHLIAVHQALELQALEQAALTKRRKKISSVNE